MRFFNVGDSVRIDRPKLADNWDDLPEDLKEFTEAFSDKILKIKRIAVEDLSNKEGEYVLSYGEHTHESTFYASELIAANCIPKEWDN